MARRVEVTIAPLIALASYVRVALVERHPALEPDSWAPPGRAARVHPRAARGYRPLLQQQPDPFCGLSLAAHLQRPGSASSVLFAQQAVVDYQVAGPRRALRAALWMRRCAITYLSPSSYESGTRRNDRSNVRGDRPFDPMARPPFRPPWHEQASLLTISVLHDPPPMLSDPPCGRFRVLTLIGGRDLQECSVFRGIGRPSLTLDGHISSPLGLPRRAAAA